MDCTVRTAQKAYRLSIPAPGRHMIYSAAMAAVIGEKLGLSPEEITAGVAHYEPAGERMRLIHRADGALILSDCYNANPQSMAAAIHTLARSGRERTAAVLGDMGELGALSPQAHYDMGMCCAREQIDAVAVSYTHLGHSHGIHVSDAEFTILQHGFSHGQQGTAVGQAGVLKAAGQEFSILHQGDGGGFCRGFQT